MINRLIDVALKNRFIVVVAVPRPRRLGLVGADVHADRRDSGSLRQPGDRLHRLARPQPAGGRGPGHVSAHGEPPGARRRPRRPVAVGVRLLDDLRRLRGQRRSVLRADARARAHEPRHEEPARGRHADARTGRDRRRPRLLVHGREPDAIRSASCARCRTGSSAISSTPCPASRRSPPSAAIVQQYQIDVDPNRLRDLQPAAQRGGVRRPRQQSECRRQRPRVERRLADRARRRLDRSPSTTSSRSSSAASNGVPVYVEQVANVQIGNAFRVASLVKGTQEAVGGVVVARTGVNTKDVIDAVKARIAQIAAGLPPGVTIVPFYDRSDLIEQAVDTLRTALIEEIVLVTLAHVIFLMHFRSILIVTIPLPLAVLMSFLGHVLRRHLLQHHEPRRHRHRDWRARRCRHRRHGERVPIRRAARRRPDAIAARSGRRSSTRRDWSDGPCSSRWRSSCSPSFRCSR